MRDVLAITFAFLSISALIFATLAGVCAGWVSAKGIKGTKAGTAPHV
jgi:hypothetical protein